MSETNPSFAMPDRRQMVIGGALIAAAAAAAALTPRRTVESLSGAPLERMIPLHLGDYRFATATGLIVPDSEAMGSHIYDQVLTRIYTARDRPPVMLLIAYGSAQDAGLAVHRPEACYPSSGYKMGKSARVALSGAPGQEATALSATRGGEVEHIYFWTRIGDRFPTSPMEEKWAVLKANVGGILPDGILVRLSIRMLDRAAAITQMMAFNALLLDTIGDAGRRLLLGRDTTS